MKARTLKEIVSDDKYNLQHEFYQAFDVNVYRRKVQALVEIVKTIKPQHPRKDLRAAIAALEEDGG